MVTKTIARLQTDQVIVTKEKLDALEQKVTPLVDANLDSRVKALENAKPDYPQIDDITARVKALEDSNVKILDELDKQADDIIAIRDSIPKPCNHVCPEPIPPVKVDLKPLQDQIEKLQQFKIDITAKVDDIEVKMNNENLKD